PFLVLVLVDLDLIVVDLVVPLVSEADLQTLVEEGHLLEPGPQVLIGEVRGLEDRRVRPELHRRAGLLRLLTALEFTGGHTAEEVHRPDVAVALDLDLEAFGQGVDDGRTHTVQAAGHGVSAAAELAA